MSKEEERKVKKGYQGIIENIDINLNWFQIETEIRKHVHKLLIPFQHELDKQRKVAEKEYQKLG